MDENDLDNYLYLTGVCVGYFLLFLVLVGRYLPRWRRGFSTTFLVVGFAGLFSELVLR